MNIVDQQSPNVNSSAGPAATKEAMMRAEARPPSLSVLSEGIPAELRDRPQWVLWKYQRQKKGWTKIPVQPLGEPASSTDPATWESFQAAYDIYEGQGEGGPDGLGFVFSKDDPLAGVDLDNCRNPETGALAPWAQEAIVLLNSYAEVSPTGTGVKVFLKGQLPQTGRKKGNYELYDSGRYFTMTGHRLPGTPAVIENRQVELTELHRRVFGGKAKATSTPAPPNGTGPVGNNGVCAGLTDDEVIAKATHAKNGEQFARLWGGDTNAHGGDDSAADLALCNHLVFWTQGDADRMDRLFRQSGLMRPKWDAKRGKLTYGKMTIAKALEDATSVHGHNGVHHGNGQAAPPPEAVPAPALGKLGLDDAARHGLAGEFVKIVESHTESDPAALLIQFLAAFGIIIGTTAHFVVERTIHYLKLFPVLVGMTSKGRKGTSWDIVRSLFELVDGVWAKGGISSGLSTGEGMIWAVRDPVYTTEPIKEKGHITGYATVMKDEGISDKRKLFFESEFASVLKAIERQGNRLSIQIRQAWDGCDLRNATKTDPYQATGAHLGLVSHITVDELRRYLTVTEKANGTGNRLLWLLVYRSKELPFGGNLDMAKFATIAGQVKAAVNFAKGIGAMGFTECGTTYWEEIYSPLSAERPGLMGCLLNRAEAYVRRLACLYALLDQQEHVDLVHLKAAQAVWKRCEESVARIFGQSQGDPTADTILTSLKSSPQGLTQTEISALFKNNLDAAEIARALDVLQKAKLAHLTTETKAGGKVKVKRWFYVTHGTKSTNSTKT